MVTVEVMIGCDELLERGLHGGWIVHVEVVCGAQRVGVAGRSRFHALVGGRA